MVSVARTVALVASAEDGSERVPMREGDSATPLALPGFEVKVDDILPPDKDAARFRRY